MPKASKTLADLQPLLIIRAQAKQLLSCGEGKLRHLERLGLLHPIKLTGGHASLVHYRVSEIEAIARGEVGGAK